jgi:predicted dinucleotide-binding enzyme
MKIAVLGTGMVGRAHVGRLSELGHDVVMGTQDVEATLNKSEPDPMGGDFFVTWHEKHPDIKLATFADAAKESELIIGALNGQVTLKLLKAIEPNLSNKVLIDISNPLDFSKGMPPSLFACNTDSLGEQIQRALPQVKVVKSLNTISADIQVCPKNLAKGNHVVFMSGNHADAKAIVSDLLKSYGWQQIIDLGDIITSRGAEMMMPMWLQLMKTEGTSRFNYQIIKD